MALIMLEFIHSSLRQYCAQMNWENPDLFADKKLNSHQFCTNRIRLTEIAQDREIKISFKLVADLPFLCKLDVDSKFKEAEGSIALISSNCFPNDQGVVGDLAFCPSDFPDLLFEIY